MDPGISLRDPHRDSPEQAAPADSDGDSGVYEIEAILDAKRGKDTMKYFVRWKGYADEENSWVDERDAGGAKDLIAEYCLHHGKMNRERTGEKSGRKSDARSKASSRRPVAPSVEPCSEPTLRSKKKRKTRPESADEDAEEDIRKRKRGRKSNGINRKSPLSPASSDEAHSSPELQEPSRKSNGINRKSPLSPASLEEAHPSPELQEPSTIEKWGNLPSWEQHIQTIAAVEKGRDGLIIYFELMGEKGECRENSEVCADKFPQKLLKFYESHIKWIHE